MRSTRPLTLLSITAVRRPRGPTGNKIRWGLWNPPASQQAFSSGGGEELVDETLRGQQQAENQPPLQAPSADDGTVIHTLTEALRRERTTHRERVQELEQRLAAAHGEILRLHRVIQSHGPRP